MDLVFRKKLEKLAWERARATSGNDERWSFVFRTDGAVNLSYCAWSEMDDCEFYGEIDGLGLQWSDERASLIESGEVDPNEDELHQWRQAMCRKLAVNGEAGIVWIVPVTIGSKIAGYALFLFHAGGAPEDEPILEGVFESVEEAKATLAKEGVVIDD